MALGGRGTLYGAAAGAIIVNALKSYFTALAPEIWLFLLGGLFVLVTIFMPKGLMGIQLNGFIKKKQTILLSDKDPR